MIRYIHVDALISGSRRRIEISHNISNNRGAPVGILTISKSIHTSNSHDIISDLSKCITLLTM